MKHTYIEISSEEILEQETPKDPRKVVVIGGGTGQPKVLRALNALDIYPSAIVTMADDGGSSGRLREEMGIVPPGDVRNCLAALSSPYKQVESELLGYRFSTGEGLTGHALGNLILAAFADITGSFEHSVKILERFLRVHGRVLPSTFEDVVLSGFDKNGKTIRGQKELALNEVAISEVRLSPDKPAPNPEAIQAIEEADLIILAPGSLFTSLIPNLLVAGMSEAIRNSEAEVMYIANVRNAGCETTGMNPYDYLLALEQHGLGDRIDKVLLNYRDTQKENEELASQINELGIVPLYYNLADEKNSLHHDTHKLQLALKDFL